MKELTDDEMGKGIELTDEEAQMFLIALEEQSVDALNKLQHIEGLLSANPDIDYSYLKDKEMFKQIIKDNRKLISSIEETLRTTKL